VLLPWAILYEAAGWVALHWSGLPPSLSYPLLTVTHTYSHAHRTDLKPGTLWVAEQIPGRVRALLST
jgi:hypothetical protein